MRCAAFVKQPRFDVLRLPLIHHPRNIHTHTNVRPNPVRPNNRAKKNAVATIGHVARVVRCRSSIGLFSSSEGTPLGRKSGVHRRFRRPDVFSDPARARATSRVPTAHVSSPRLTFSPRVDVNCRHSAPTRTSLTAVPDTPTQLKANHVHR